VITPWILFALLLVLALAMLFWGLARRERFYQYPTLAGATWLFFMCPQILGALRNPGKYPDMVLRDHGLETALAMCVLCAAFGWLGYARPLSVVTDDWQRRAPPPSLFQAGLLLYAIGFFGAYKLADLSGGFIHQFTEGGHYALEWRGLPVLYFGIAQMIYPGLLLTLLATLHQPSTVKKLTVAVFSLYPIAVSVLLGRRSMTAFLCLIFLLAWFFVRNWAPPRWLFATSLVLGGVFVLIAPQYRALSQYGFRNGEISEIQVKASVREVLSGTSYAEFDALVVTAGAVNRTGILDLGKGFYNSTVAQLVPRQIVGEEFKQSLFLGGSDEDIGYQAYRWSIPYGSTPTGPSNAFAEFWFFGASLYYLLGYLSRLLWERAQRIGTEAQIWYTIWVMMIPESIYGALVILPGRLWFYFLFLWPVLWWLRTERTWEEEVTRLDPERA